MLKMKKLKLVLTLFALTIMFNANAQVKQEKQAKKIANEMTDVLLLNKQESKAVYKIQLNKFEEGASIKEKYADQPEVKKEKLNKLGSKVYNQLKELLGMERLKEWKAYKESKNKK